MKNNTFFLGIGLSVIGLLMAIWPAGCIQAVVVLLGIEAIVNGGYQLIYTRKLFTDTTFQYSVMIRGMISIVIGLLAVFLPLHFAAAMWTFMLYILAVYLLVSSVLLLFSIGKLRDSSVDRRQFVLEALISIVVAIIIFMVPVKIGTTLVRIGGIIILLASGLFIFYYLKNRPEVQEPIEVMDDISGNLEKSNE